MDKDRPFRFVELDCMEKEIETMTIASKSRSLKQEGLVYIRDHSLSFHPITPDRDQTTANDKFWCTNQDLLKNMYGAKLIWWPPNALILAKDIGLFWMNKELITLYNHQHEGITNYHVDIFYSGEGKRLGFLWSGLDLKKNIYVWLGLQQEDNSIRTYEVTHHVLKQMNSLDADNNKIASHLPWLFLKDRSQNFSQLHGALVYNTKHAKCIVKYIFIDIENNKITITDKQKTNTFDFINYNDIKILEPYNEKFIVHIGFRLVPQTQKLKSNFFQLFSFPKDAFDLNF